MGECGYWRNSALSGRARLEKYNIHNNPNTTSTDCSNEYFTKITSVFQVEEDPFRINVFLDEGVSRAQAGLALSFCHSSFYLTYCLDVDKIT